MCTDEIVQSGQDGAEPMTSQQVTLWLQALFLFSVVWSLGGTVNGRSRKKFDAFYRNLIMGTIPSHPRPQSVKLTKNNVFPERGQSTALRICSSSSYSPGKEKCQEIVICTSENVFYLGSSY